jgi:hypothetical protein
VKQLRSAIAGVMAAAIVMGTTTDARANAGTATSGGSATTSTTTWIVVPLITTAGIIALIYFLVIKKDDKPATTTASGPTNPPPPPPAAPGAMLYLRDLGPEVAQSLATGHGQVVTDLADALSIPAPHRPAFSRALRAHRERLLDLASPERLTEERSVAFLGEIVAAMHDDDALSADLAAWTARMDLAHQG